MCCSCVPSPQSLTLVSSWGFARLPPSCNSNYLEYIRSARCRVAEGRRRFYTRAANGGGAN
ncbi:hypothetical protein AOL60_20975 [Salmonella enterica]|uniref:Uncharacterized protein n=1 Tax=Salmonella anatum TaxID=58712 RepID=A0A5W3E8S6_SALAN|nr:hypothetical protein [Salmonella enterica subsp. enterica serovar Hessarek]EAA8197394.1 hypothetical protein [Salmonella enterica]EAA8441486.1 hypothetical protein [Salmonella enterica subsp. enterica]EBV7984631.1 hypothetical protein [Salmonella enterica subsp. enterica serovar Michigan]EBW1440784.1 hypothetical protein [Salmonella enterica subsp. enterica serovar Hartford]EBW5996707.1 hypothetical protein [Salmonella enterica subsp. enterica serovar Anatum]HAC6655785.1 hypothetical prote